MRIDVAVDIWFLDLLIAGQLADFQRSPVAVSTHSVRHRRTHFVATFLRPPHATWRTSVPPLLLLFAGLLAGAGPRPPAIRQAGAAVNLTGRTVDTAAAR
jgi:hypothetical protein